MWQANELSTHIYAPNNVGFIHTAPERFTYFSGSKAGARTTFGFSCEEMLALLNKAVPEFIKQYADSNNGDINRYLKNITNLLATVQQQVADFKSDKSYTSDKEAAEAVVASGHIPIILGSILPAVQYQRAARSVSASDVEYYFGRVPSARQQCREYLVKQDIMKAIAAFRNRVNSERYTHTKGETLYFFNSLINMLDEKIIKLNQKSMPTECEQFDLYPTFRQKIHTYWCQIPNEPAYKEFFAEMANALEFSKGATTYHAQQALADAMYTICIAFINKHVGINSSSESMELTVVQDNHLQTILPLVAYLNSEQNPFARNGIFGKMANSNFHIEALGAYQSHESNEKPQDYRVDEFAYEAKNHKHPSFDDAQIEKLLFGASDLAQSNTAAGGFFGGIGQTLRGLLTDGTANASQTSDSNRRRELLALPTPQQYLMLEGPKPLSPPDATPQKRP